MVDKLKKHIDFFIMNEENKDIFYWVYRIVMLKYDIYSCTLVIDRLGKIEPEIILYMSQQLIVHINEGYKLFKSLQDENLISKIVDEEIQSNEVFQKVIEQCDFDNKHTENNRLFKSFRDDIVHYTNSKKFDRIEFEKVIKTIKNFDQEEYMSIYHTDLSLEKQCQMIMFNRNIINKGISQDEFGSVLWNNAIALTEVCDMIINSSGKLKDIIV